MDGTELPDYMTSGYTVTVIVGMPDGDRAITTMVDDDSYFDEVAIAAKHLYGQRQAALRRQAEQEGP